MKTKKMIPIKKRRNSLHPEQDNAEAKVYARNPEYGTFKSRAKYLRALKQVTADHLRDMGSEDKLTDSQEVALGEIFNKISRIINGDNNKIDSWLDLAGYATLVRKELQGEIV